MSKHTPTPWPQNDKPITDLFRAIACVNAFHSEDGREIKTEKIEEGLFWEMRDLLGQLVLDYQDVPDATDADSQALFADARALLAKLED